MQSKAKDTLYELLTNIFPKVELIEEQQLKKHHIPLTIKEVRMIVEISKNPNKTVGEISQLLCISTSTLSIGASRLEKKGYVIRTQNNNDKRIIHLNISDSGQKVVCVYQKIIFGIIDSLIADLRVGESSILIRSLESVNTYFKRQIEE